MSSQLVPWPYPVLTSVLIAPAPSSALHKGSLSLRLESSRSIDFDSIPSPRKTLGLSRTNHSHTLSEDLDASRNKLKEKPRPKPRPVFKPVIPTPSPPPDVQVEDEDEDLPEVPATPSPPRPRKSVKPPSTSVIEEEQQFDDDSGVDMSLVTSPQATPRQYRLDASPLPEAAPASPQPSDDEDDIPVRPRSSLAASKAAQSASKSRQSVPAVSMSISPPASPVVAPRKSKAKAASPPPPPLDSDDSSGPEDFGAPFEPADDAMDFDVGGGGGPDMDDVPMDFDDAGGDNQSPDPEEAPVQPEEDEEEDEDEAPARKTAKEKGKGKAKPKSQDSSRRERERSVLSPVVEEDDGMEDDIAAGLQTVGDGDVDVDDEEDDDQPPPEPEVQPRAKKVRATKNAAPKKPSSKRRGTSALPDEIVTMGVSGGAFKLCPGLHARPMLTFPSIHSDKENANGVRRSTRQRHAPLEYWRGERVLLGRSEEGPAPCPVFKGFVEIPIEVPEPLGGKKRRRTGRSASRGASRAPSSRRETSTAPGSVQYGGVPPEDGLDDDTAVDGTVKDWISGQPLRRRKWDYQFTSPLFLLILPSCTRSRLHPEADRDR